MPILSVSHPGVEGTVFSCVCVYVSGCIPTHMGMGCGYAPNWACVGLPDSQATLGTFCKAFGASFCCSFKK